MKPASAWVYVFRCLVFLALVLGLCGYIFSRKLTQDLEVLLEEENLRAARLAARILGREADLAAGAREAATLSDARVTIVAVDGRVLADTESDPASMDNHASRPEILEAASQGWGHAVRKSTTLGSEMLYTAVRLDDPGSSIQGFARLARSMERVQQITLSFSELVWTSVPIVILLSVLALYFFIELRIARQQRLL